MIVTLNGRNVTLTDEQLDAYAKLTKLQKSVSLASIAGGDIVAAHRDGGGKCKTEKYRNDLATQILAHPRVVSFVDSFKVDASPEIAHSVMQRDEMMQGLTTIARTTIDDVVSFTERPSVDMENGNEIMTSSVHVKSIEEIPKGARSAIKSVKQTKNGLELTLYDSLAARKQLAELQGFNAPTKTELSGPGGKPIQTQEIPDEELESKLRSLGLGRYHNQLGAKRVDK